MNNRRLWFGLLALIVFVAVGAVWQVAQKDERPTGAVSDQIRSWADENTARRAQIDVTCPDPVEWEVGGSFHCIVSQGRQAVRVTVTMENEAGTVTWQAE